MGEGGVLRGWSVGEREVVGDWEGGRESVEEGEEE